MDVIDFISYGFAQRALISGVFIALLCSTLGLFLVLKKFSMIGDGLSHASFGTVALALFLGYQPIYFSLPLIVIASLGILKLSEKTAMFGDAAIGIVSAIGMSSGILLSSISGKYNADLFSYLFGNILLISKGETVISVILSLVVLSAIYFYFHDLIALAFDEESARVSGVKTRRLNTALAVLTAITVVLAVRIVGAMLISSMIVISPVAALQLKVSFKKTILFSMVFSSLAVVFGVFSSFLLNYPTGPTIIMFNLIFLFVIIISNKLFKK